MFFKSQFPLNADICKGMNYSFTIKKQKFFIGIQTIRRILATIFLLRFFENRTNKFAKIKIDHFSLQNLRHQHFLIKLKSKNFKRAKFQRQIIIFFFIKHTFIQNFYDSADFIPKFKVFGGRICSGTGKISSLVTFIPIPSGKFR